MIDQEKEDFLLAKRFGLEPVYDLSNYPFIKEKVRRLPYSFVKQRLALPLKEHEGKLLVAISHPYDLEVLEEIRCMTGMDVQEVFCPEPQLKQAIEKCYHQGEKEASLYIEGLKKEGNGHKEEIGEEEYDLLSAQDNSPVVRLLNMIIAEAIQQGASDIHFEPLENEMDIRYRIDGVLQFRHSPPPEMQKQLVTRVKVMAKLDIAEHRLPQDGRIKLNMGGRQIDFRVSTVPVVYGERIVMRILDNSNIVLGLDKIGMAELTLTNLRKYLHQNQGIILVTGPTGSGKTTTLYSAISEIHSEEVNVMTIEDPVEYKLAGIAQIGVNPKIKLSFATGLRHILRQDPDIIMIGEIRDKETAEIAIQSSLTGHLVLSTLHTNDAPSALTRLVDMGIESYLLSSSILAILAQRLVRRICEDCKVGYKPSDTELSELGLKRKSLESDMLYKGEGCGSCFGSGYRGRSGIYELMPVNHGIKMQLLRSADATQLQKAAVESGMKTLREEGAVLANQGVTTTSEVLRVTRQIELYS
ncbi:type II secretion system ATPase GspE [Simkania negevensis]|uniref:protein-secreting ATPase n=1 Tax=Simkania negevensis (strain ATCC VR-1471 / DSM 27360 / Z) TaxID=331113 RepID=F8L595_SIMNZ|nr:type II secretion system ATPase GspE [Simkania negevensis]CCB87978.1 general secretion pathway protein E [Simkania negevensis Z]